MEAGNPITGPSGSSNRGSVGNGDPPYSTEIDTNTPLHRAEAAALAAIDQWFADNSSQQTQSRPRPSPSVEIQQARKVSNAATGARSPFPPKKQRRQHATPPPPKGQIPEKEKNTPSVNKGPPKMPSESGGEELWIPDTKEEVLTSLNLHNALLKGIASDLQKMDAQLATLKQKANANLLQPLKGKSAKQKELEADIKDTLERKTETETHVTALKNKLQDIRDQKLQNAQATVKAHSGVEANRRELEQEKESIEGQIATLEDQLKSAPRRKQKGIEEKLLDLRAQLAKHERALASNERLGRRTTLQ